MSIMAFESTLIPDVELESNHKLHDFAHIISLDLLIFDLHGCDYLSYSNNCNESYHSPSDLQNMQCL